ncbi:TLC domain-containing protein [Mycena kentingensis (nom. inval.)]|nr:TLC domain-containing protein [Mycena kentingensis (nom. inval.)]
MEALYTALPHLQPHFPVFLASFATFTIIQLVLVPLFANLLFPQQWRAMNARARNNWAIHICSQVHALVILPLAWRCIGLPELDADRAFGWHERSGTVQAVASGYFLWDTFDAIVNFDNIGFVLHGLACFAIYLLSFRPFLAYYAARFLLWETSTLFLNVHWALDKMNRTGGTLQLINGVCLVSSFVVARLIFGGYSSIQFFQTLWNGWDVIPPVAIAITGVGNIVLQSLNWFWLTKMISSLRKRFASSDKAPTPNGAVANGKHKSKSE